MPGESALHRYLQTIMNQRVAVENALSQDLLTPARSAGALAAEYENRGNNSFPPGQTGKLAQEWLFSRDFISLETLYKEACAEVLKAGLIQDGLPRLERLEAMHREYLNAAANKAYQIAGHYWHPDNSSLEATSSAWLNAMGAVDCMVIGVERILANLSKASDAQVSSPLQEGRTSTDVNNIRMKEIAVAINQHDVESAQAAPAAEAKPTENEVSDDGTDPTRRLTPEAEPVTNARISGLSVDVARRVIERDQNSVDLSGSKVKWHIFQAAYNAFPNSYNLEDLAVDYPGEFNTDARKATVTPLNRELEKIDLRIRNRTLIDERS